MVLLDCLDAEGKPKYTLPAQALGRHTLYEMFWRPRPCLVTHHVKGKTIELPQPEFVAIGIGLHHCISVSVDEQGRSVGAYVNINLPATQTASGWSWRDLELDVVVRRGIDERWRAAVVDLGEYRARALTDSIRVVAEHEVSTLIAQIDAGEFPFDDLRKRYAPSLFLHS